MSCITRCVFRWGLISALALGGATLLIGPERVAAGLAHVRAKAQSVVDQVSDDPNVLRRQLADLAEEYPQRIAKVKKEIASVNSQITQFGEDSEVARRVVAMSTDDMKQLDTLIAEADGVEGRPVYVRFDGVRFRLDDAKAERLRIANVRTNFADRAANNTQQLEILQQQQSRLVQILGRLQEEQATFETQMWQLDRQIDAIERNDRLIEMMQQLQATFNTYDSWGKLDNLKQLQGRMAELAAVQQAQLDTLEQMGVRQDYEARARYDLEHGVSAPEPENTSDEGEVEVSDDSFAWMPVVIE